MGPLLGDRHDRRLHSLFQEAQTEYLKGNWQEAEDLLRRLLRRNSADVNAHLMLATLFRRTRRLEECQAQLRRMERFEASLKWQPEIDREQYLLRRCASEMESNEPDQASAGSDLANGGSDLANGGSDLANGGSDLSEAA